jgi:hypothetical protein
MPKLLFLKEHLLAGTEDKILIATNAFQNLVTKIHRIPAASRSEEPSRRLSLQSFWCIGCLAQKFFDLLQCSRHHIQPV